MRSDGLRRRAMVLMRLHSSARLALAGVLGLVMLAGSASDTVAQNRGAPSGDPILRIDTPMHQAMIRRLAVDARGERLVTAGDDKSIRVWQLVPSQPSAGAHSLSARLTQTLRVPIDSGHEGQLFALAMSPDGTRIAAGGWTCWDWERAGCVYVFDVSSGEMLRRVRGLPDAVSALAWSPDGRHLAVGLQGRAGIRVLRTDSFEEVAADRAYEDKVMELAYDPAGRLAAVALDGRVRLYRPDHRLLGRLTVPGGQQPATVRFHPDGARLAVGFLDVAAVTVLDGASLQPQAFRRAEDGAQRNLSNVAWSLDGSTLFAAGERVSEGPNFLYRWRGAGLDERDVLPMPAQRVSELQAMPGQAVAFAAEDPRLGIVDAQGRITLDRVAEISDFSDARFVLRASVDGASIGFTRADGQEQRFDAEAVPGPATGTVTSATTLPPLTAAIERLPGWQIERAADRQALRVNGRAVALDDYEFVRSWALHPGGEALFLGTEWALRRMDRAGSEVWRVRLSAIVRAVVVSGNGQWVIAALSDGTIRWYRTRDGAEALAYFAHASTDDWIAWTPAGYYMSSLQGDQYVGWHVNQGADRAPDFHRAVQFERVLYRPDIVTAALAAGARPNVRQVASAPPRFDRARLEQIAPPRLAVRLLGVNRAADGAARARLRITGERGAQPLQELTVYVNEIPVTPARERRVGWTETSRVARELEVPLGAASNDIRVESFTEVAMGVAERFVALDVADAKPRAAGDLYVLAIGNNRFPNLPPAAHLEFAARDAEALAAALATHARGTFRRVHAEVIADGRRRQADRKTVLDALAFTRQARAEDTVVIFLASHGVSDRAGNYWFVPRDATAADLKAVEDSTAERSAPYNSLVSWSVFFDALRDTVGRRLLIVDTCQAKGIEGRFESFSLLKRSAASRFSLMVAAQSSEESQEYPPGQHGLFTYALLQALSPGGPDIPGASADRDGDGQVSIAEAFARAAPLVARLHDRALGSQTPALIASPALANSPLISAIAPAVSR